MINKKISRRRALQAALVTCGAAFLHCRPSAEEKRTFRFCLNTSTIGGQNLGLSKSMDIAAQAGYDAIEIWMRDLDAFLKTGASLQDVRNRANELGLTIEDAVDFNRWIVDDESERAAALEQAKRNMAKLAEIGCPRMASPPVGATAQAGLDLFAAAERFAALAAVGEALGVMPQLEIWGFSANLHSLGEALLIASQSGNPHVGILADVYHLYRGGSPFEGLHFVPPSALQIFHVNDYPTSPAREQLKDGDRLMPGDGIAPWPTIVSLLREKNSPIIISLELFNPDFWKPNPMHAARLGLKKMKQVFGS
jgi:2-keto-myo-inositol isomerase